MKKIILLLLCAALALGAASCRRQESSTSVIGGTGSSGQDTIAGEDVLPAAPSQENGEEDASSSEQGWQEVSSTEYSAYLLDYVVPYGNLKFYNKTWTDAADLGPEAIFEFALQKNFNFYNSAMDYSQVFGDQFVYLQVPEKWFDEAHGLVYPQDIIENTAVEYFGLDSTFMRQAKAYIPTKSGYAAPLPGENTAALSSTAELLPEVTAVRKKGSRAEITFTLSPCDPSGKLIEGDVLTRVMVVEDKSNTFRYVSVTAL